MKSILAWTLLLAWFGAHASDALPTASVYHLDIQLTDQSGRAQRLDLYRGSPVLIAMFYGSCPMACPLLIDMIRAIERELRDVQRAKVRVMMVSIDPTRDTPAALDELARKRRIELQRWTLARTDARSVQMLAAALNVQYRELPGGEFNHSSVITLLDSEGSIRRRTATLSAPDAAFVDELRRLTERNDQPDG